MRSYIKDKKINAFNLSDTSELRSSLVLEAKGYDLLFFLLYRHPLRMVNFQICLLTCTIQIRCAYLPADSENSENPEIHCK